MFIKLTSITGTKHRINSNTISRYKPNNNSGTAVIFQDGVTIHYSESVEEVDKLLGFLDNPIESREFIYY